MRDLKYIIVLIGTNKVAIVFNGLLSHSAVVPPGTKIISAGFCDLTFGRVMEIKVNIHDTRAASLPTYLPQAGDNEIIQQTLNRTMF